MVKQGIDDAWKNKAKIFGGREMGGHEEGGELNTAIAPEIKYNYLKETKSGMLLEKFQVVYASMSFTNKLYLRWELYKLMKGDDTSMQAHINTFNQALATLRENDRFMLRCKEEKKNGVEVLYGKGLVKVEEEPKRRVTKRGVSLKEVTLVIRNVTFARRMSIFKWCARR